MIHLSAINAPSRIPKNWHILTGDNDNGGSGSIFLNGLGKITSVISGNEVHDQLHDLMTRKIYAIRSTLILQCFKNIINSKKIDANFQSCKNVEIISLPSLEDIR
jgi:hypothetical protein